MRVAIPVDNDRRMVSAHQRHFHADEDHRTLIGDVTVLQVAGRIVLGDGAAELRSRMNDLIDEARLKFLLDLTDVTYIDSFGVGVIAAKYVSVRRKGGDVRLLRLSPRSRRVMRISGLLKIFQSFESDEDAINSFTQG